MTTIESTQAKLRAIAAQFLVLNLEQACAFYTERLGFRLAFVYDDFYAGVERDGMTLHLKLWDEPDPSRAFKKRGEHLDVYITTDNIDALYEEYQGRGVSFLQPLEARPWGTREFAVEDNSGYILYFGQEA